MKWIRRILATLLLLAVLLLIASAAGYKLLHRRPQWYTPTAKDPEAVRQAANRANQRLIAASTETARLQSAMRHPESASINAERTGQAAPRQLQLDLSEDEINAFFTSWDQQEHWSQHYSRFFHDPQVFLTDGRILLAATATELDMVVSAEIEPLLDEGKLQFRIVRVMGGTLPLPQSFWESYRSRWVRGVELNLPRHERGARIDADGWANEDLVQAVMGRLFVASMKDQSAPPILFFPTFLQTGKRKDLPVRLTAVSIEQKTLHLSFVPLTTEERSELLATLAAQSKADPATPQP